MWFFAIRFCGIQSLFAYAISVGEAREITNCSHTNGGPLSIELPAANCIRLSCIMQLHPFHGWQSFLPTRSLYYSESRHGTKFRAEAREIKDRAWISAVFILSDYRVDSLKICALCRRTLYCTALYSGCGLISACRICKCIRAKGFRNGDY